MATGCKFLSLTDGEDDDIWKRKYLTLESRLKSVELENQKIVNRIYHVRKYLKRCRRERSFLIKKCEEYGVDYKKAQAQYTENMVAELNSSNADDNNSQLKKRSGGVAVKKGKGKAQHKPEKERDPDAPKKPANAFFMFCQQQRNSMQEDHKDSSVGHHELTKHLAKEWNTLAAEGKKVYYKMYEKDKERYEQEMKQYAKDKPPKETTKIPKAKKQKSKKTATKTQSEASKSPSSSTASLMDPAPDPHNSLVDSPSFNLLNTLPFSNIPSPMLEIVDDDESFDGFSL